jgi:hypothetical protein
MKYYTLSAAFAMSAAKNYEGEFAYGSGHINPIKAVNPGLVYEALKGDYIKMLCSIGYGVKKLRLISGDNSTCPIKSDNIFPKDLNYPSMAAEISPLKPFKVTFHRTVKNVGFPNSTYKAKIFPNSKLDIKVVPAVLSFKSLNEKKSFALFVTGRGMLAKSWVSASLVWSDGTHSVRSPIILHNQLVHVTSP